MRHPHRFAVTLAATLLVVLAAGCSRRLVTAPGPEPSPPASETTAPAVPSDRLTGPLARTLAAAQWHVIAAQLVQAGEVTTVSGGRYELQFERGSLANDELITIRDYDSDVLDVELGPHGTKFGEPVVLSIDFTGTRADPGAAWYDHSEPVVYWLNEATNRWEEVPSRTDWSRRRVEARLEHFSRYVIGGKAGWNGQPSREQE
jgi:hypothetical protein